MVINKATVERGGFHGCVYKTKVVEAAPPKLRFVRRRMEGERGFVFFACVVELD